MRIERRRGPFRTIDILLEEPTPAEIQQLLAAYDRVSILTHRPLPGTEGFRLRQKKTPLIRLGSDAEEVLRHFRDTVRNEVHRTERIEGFAVLLPDPNTAASYELYRNFEFTQGRAPISAEEFARFTVSTASLNGRLLSAVTFFQSGTAIRVRSIFSLRLGARTDADKDLYKIVGYASKRLVYEVCRYGIAHGATVVDLASINLTDPEKEPIARFKSGFGADIGDEYQYLHSTPRFRFFEGLAAVRARLRVFIHGVRGR